MSDKYVLQKTELGTNVELLLPKKAYYQGVLYDTLTDGFNPEKVTAYLQDPERSTRIMDYLNAYMTVNKKSYDWYLSKIDKIFKGYSMYEVDGVFYDDESDKIFEECTQVIRMIFRIPHEEIKGRFKSSDFEKLEIFRVMHEAQLSDLNIYHDKKEDKLKYFISNWVKILTFFIYGYLLFRIQEHILKLEDKEYEIWVVSFPSVIISRSNFEDD
jgi:hypothetical protein